MRARWASLVEARPSDLPHLTPLCQTPDFQSRNTSPFADRLRDIPREIVLLLRPGFSAIVVCHSPKPHLSDNFQFLRGKVPARHLMALGLMFVVMNQNYQTTLRYPFNPQHHRF